VKVQDWIFSIRYRSERDVLGQRRTAVVGPARTSTVEAALHLAEVPERVRTVIRSCQIVRDFVDGRLDPDKSGYYVAQRLDADRSSEWIICIGSVQEVLP
jgi:hypothetical protein